MSACALCGAGESLEFHHWCYDSGVGVRLCRQCHNKIHGGESGRVSKQQNIAEYHGGDHWHEVAIRNLIKADIENNGLSAIDVECGKYNAHRDSESQKYKSWLRSSWSRYKEYLKGNYNLPGGWQETSDIDGPDEMFRVALSQGHI